MRGLAVAVLAGLLVAGCSKPAPEREPDLFDNASEVPAAPVAAPAIEAPPPRVAEPAVNTVEALPAEADPSREEQMREDADATGLTARTAVPPDVVTDVAADPIGDLVENGGIVAP